MDNEQETIKLGIVGIKNMGVYDSQTQYKKLNVVTYNGSTYCALQNTKGNLPTNTDYWQLYAEKGDRGPQGPEGPQGPKPVKGVDYYTAADKVELESDLESDVTDEVTSQLDSLTSATPLAASSISGMTDHTRIYVNTTNGHWYWYNGTNWQDGGVYQSTAIADDSVSQNMLDDELREQIQCIYPQYTLTEGSYINNSGQIITDQYSTNYCYSSPILVNKKSKIYFKGAGSSSVAAVVVCDESGGNRKPVVTHTSTSESTIEYEVDSENDIYIILCSLTNKLSDVRIYNTLLNYDSIPYIEQKTNTNDACIIVDDEEESYTTDYFINYNNGRAQSGIGMSYTDYIEVIPNQTIKLISPIYFTPANSPDNRGLAFYNENKIYISGYQYTKIKQDTINVPNNAKYMRMTRINNILIYYTSLMNIIKNHSIENQMKNFNHYNLYKSFLHVGVIGDSLASGESAYKEGENTRYVDIYPQSWPQYMARMSGNTYYNFSVGGMTARTWLTNAKGYPLASDGNHPCEAYFIGLGQNDYRSETLGSASDINLSDYTQNANTFYGNYAGIIQRMKALYPKAKFFLVTMPSTANPITTFNTAIRYMTTIFDNCYLIDLEKDYLSYFASGSFIDSNKRSGHFNAIAYNYIAQLFAQAVSKIMLDNPNDFRQVEFINTNYEWI